MAGCGRKRRFRTLLARVFGQPCRKPHRGPLRPTLQVIQLEDRRVLSGIPAALVGADHELVLHAGPLADDGNADTFVLSREADRIRALIDGQEVYSGIAADIARIRVEGSADPDTLILDFAGGNPLPSGVVEFDGGGGTIGATDSLVLLNSPGGGPIDATAYDFRGFQAGEIHVSLGNGATGISTANLIFSGLESVRDATRPDRLVFRSASGGETLVLGDGGDAEPGVSLLSARGVRVAFDHPDLSVGIETGSPADSEADRVDLQSFDADHPIDLSIHGGADDLVAISGTIDLDGGNLAIQSGSIQVGGFVSNIAGAALDAGPGGNLAISGTIDASNLDPGHIGGTVHLFGDRIELTGSARIDASGAAGGGTILVGGSFHGRDPTTLNATTVYVGPDVVLLADAVGSGDGGTVIVWADRRTHFSGTILARGGPDGGSGQTAEVSGKEALVFEGRVDLSAPAGAAGTLVLDPGLVEIDAVLAALIVSQLNSSDVVIEADEIRVLAPVEATDGNFNLSLVAPTIVFEDGANLITRDGDLVLEGDVTLAEGAAVVLSTGPDAGGDILIQGAVDGTFGPAGEGLTLLAGAGSVLVSGAVGSLDPLALSVFDSQDATFFDSVNSTTIVLADLGGEVAFEGDVTAVAMLTGSEDYRLIFRGAANAIENGAIFVNTGGVVLGDGGDLSFTAVSGNLLFDGPVAFLGNTSLAAPGGEIRFNGAVEFAADVVIEAGAGSLAFEGPVAFAGDASLAAFDGEIQFNGGVNLAGEVAIEAAGTITFLGTLGSSQGGEHGLTLASGADIEFYDTVGGGSGNALGAITILTAENVRAYATILAAGLVQLEGFGTTTLAGQVTTTGEEGVDITAAQIALDATTIAAFGGRVRLDGPVGLSGDVSIDAAGPIVFESTLGSSSGPVSGLTLVSRGEIRFNDAVGPGLDDALGVITITDAVDVFAHGTLAAAAFVQRAGSGITVLEDDVTVGSGGLDITSGRIVLDGLTITSGGGIVRFGGPLELTGEVAIEAGDTITFEDTVVSGGAGPQPLTLSSEADIFFEAAVGAEPGGSLGAITVTTAADVTAASTIRAESLVQWDGSGTTTLEEAVSTTAPGGVDITSSRVVLDGLMITAAGGGIVRFGGPVELAGEVTIAADGGITFEDALTSPGNALQPLTLATHGDIAFSGEVGQGPGNALGPISILAAVNVTAAAAIQSERFVERYGSGTTTFQDSVTTTAFEGLDISAGRIVLGGPTITAAGLGIVRLDGPVELAADVAIEAEDSIFFEDTLASPDGAAWALTLAAGGELWFRGTVGAGEGNALGAVTIAGAIDVIAAAAWNSASFVQLDGRGTTVLHGDVATTQAEGLDITAGAIVLDGLAITALGGGIVRFNGPVDLTGNAAIDAEGAIRFEQLLVSSDGRAQGLTLASQAEIEFYDMVGAVADGRLGAVRITTAADVAAYAVVHAASLVQEDGFGTTTFYDDVTTTTPEGLDITSGLIVLDGVRITTDGGGAVRFDGLVDLTGDAAIAASGTITFEQAVTSSVGGQALRLSSGAQIHFRDAVGMGPDEALGAITIVSAVDVTTGSTMDAASLVQLAGFGTTTLGDDVTTTAVQGVNITANRIALDSPSSAGLNIVNLAGGLVRFNGAMELRSDVTIDTTDGTIQFAAPATIDSEMLEYNSLTLTAGTGSVRFNADIGNSQPIGNLTVTQADTGVFFGGNLGPVRSVRAQGAIDIGSVEAILGGIVLDARDGSTVFFTTADFVRFNGPVTLRSSAWIDTSNAGAADGAEIRFTAASPIDSQAEENNALILTAGPSGLVSFNADIGAGRPLSQLIVTEAWGVALGNDFGDADLAPMSMVAIEGDPRDPEGFAIDIGSINPIGEGGIVLNAGNGSTLSFVTTADSVRLNGAVLLESDASVDISNGDFHVPVEIRFTLHAPIDSQAGEYNDLVLTAAAGIVSFNADIGAEGPLGQLIITDAWGVAFGNDYLDAVPDHGPITTVRVAGDPLDPDAWGINVGELAPIGGAGTTLDAGDGNQIALITRGAAVRFDGTVMLDSDVLLDTTGDGASAGAEIRFTLNSPIDSQDGENNDLVLTAGTDGTVNFNANIGTDWPLGQLIVTAAGGVVFGGDAGADPDFGPMAEVRVDGDLDPMNAEAFDIDIGSLAPIGTGGILFNGGAGDAISFSTTSDAVRFHGAVQLQGDAIIDTTAAGLAPDGAEILFDGTIDGSGRGIDPKLSLVSHTGTITVTGPVGELAPLGTLSLQDDQPESTGPAVFLDAVHVNSIETVGQPYAVQLLGGGTIAEATEFLNTGGVTFGDTPDDDLAFGRGVTSTASHTSLGGTTRTLDGDIQVAAATVIADTRLITAGGTIGFDGPVDGELGEDSRLELTAGSGAVEFRADVGADVAVGILVVHTADTVAIGSDASPVQTFKARNGIDLGSDLPIGMILLNGGVDGLLAMSTAGGAIRLNGMVELQSDVSINTSDDGEPLGAEIRFTANAPIDSKPSENNDLILTAGTAGAVSFNADIGTLGALGRLIVTDAAGVVFGNEPSGVDPDLAPMGQVWVEGAFEPLDPDGFAVDIGSERPIGPKGIVLNAPDAETIYFFTTADRVRFNGAVTLESNAWVDTTAEGKNEAGAEVRFTLHSPIDSRAGENNDLVLTAGTAGAVGFNADIGTRGALGQLIVTDARGVTFGGIHWPDEAPITTVRVDGDLDPLNFDAFDINLGSRTPIGPDGIVLNAGNTLSGDPLTLTFITTADAVRLNGAVELQSDVAIDTTDAHRDSGAEVRFTRNAPINSDTAEKNDLLLTTGSNGTVSFNADVGTAPTGELGRLIVTDALGIRFGNDSGGDPDLHPVFSVNVAGDGDPATWDIDLGSTGQGLGAAVIGPVGIVLNGGSGTIEINTAGDGVRLNGAVTLASAAVLDTAAGGDPGAAILFTVNATVDSQPGEQNALTLAAGIAGAVSFNAEIGRLQPIGALTVIRADGGVIFGGDDNASDADDLGPVTIVVSDGAIDIGAGTNVVTGGIALNGGFAALAITAVHGARWNGPVTLQSHLAIDAQSGQSRIEFTRAATIDSQSGEQNQLVLKAGPHESPGAGAGGVFFYGNVGAGTAGDQRLGQLTVDTAGQILLDPAQQNGLVYVVGDLILDARGNIELVSHQVAPDACQVVADRITANAGEVFVIGSGAVLISRTGAVSNAGPRLTVDPQGPQDVVTPGDPTHTVSGMIGVDGSGNYQADNLEQGRNFTLMILWNDTDADGNQVMTVIRGLSAGQQVTGVMVDENGNVSYTGSGGTIGPDGSLEFQPSAGSGPIRFEVTRVYALTYLMTLRGDVRAIVVLGNDAYETQITGTINGIADVAGSPVTPGRIVLDDGRVAVDGTSLDLNRVIDANYKHLAGERFHSAELPAEAERLPLPPAPAVARLPLEATAPPEAADRAEYIVLQSEGGLEKERVLFIVKVGPDGKEGEPHLLPDNALSNLSGLFDQLKQENLPNGLYRIYLKEAAFPRRKLVEFYKSGTSIGDPVREPGTGASPIDQEGPAAVPGEQRHEQSPEALPGKPLEQSSQNIPAHGEPVSGAGAGTLPSRMAHPVVGAAVSALAGLGTSGVGGRWMKRSEEVMRGSGEKSFTRAARLSRRLRRER
ncbi:MAG: hypothetical protein HUU20_06415 [Pirellulales bacterium]|nr:hypothetical protein [Pirellulales bacterium]